MGLHTGEVQERDGDYFGPVVNGAARLMGVAEGGQVLVSLATAEVVRGQLDEGVTFVDLGERGLRSLAQPERVFAVTWPGGPLPASGPVGARRERAPGNLPRIDREVGDPPPIR